MRYPQPNDRYDCSVLCSNFMEIEERFKVQSDEIDNVRRSSVINAGGIINEVEGETIVVNDSAEAIPYSLTLYGKAKQNTTSGKQLLDGNGMYEKIMNGITFTPVEDENGLLLYVNVNGTATENAYMVFDNTRVHAKNAEYIGSGCPVGGSDTTYFMQFNYSDADGSIKGVRDIGNGVKYTDMSDAFVNREVYIFVVKGASVSNLKFCPMIRSASITDDTYEPYTNGASPNPQFPQPIEVSGESYNLLENTATSQTINGVEFVVNEDKSITAKGTASADASAWLYFVNPFSLERGKYVVSGFDKGSGSTFYGLVKGRTSNKNYASEYKNGTEFEFDGSEQLTFSICVIKGTTVDTTFYPMIRKASVKNDRYMPYGKGSVEVKSVGKNLLKNTATPQTINGAEFTPNNDGSVTINKTPTANAFYKINELTLPKGDYILSAGIFVSSLTILQLVSLNDLPIAQTNTSKEVRFSLSEETKCILRIRVERGYVANNLTFYPMIRLATDTDSTYEPYKESKAIINGEFAGIKVSSNGNYTDQNGQQWICDEVVKYADGSGEYIQRVGKEVFDGSEEWTKANYVYFLRGYNGRQKGAVICSHFKYGKIGTTASTQYDLMIDTEVISQIRVMYSAMETIEDFKTWLQENNITVYYELAEPITTPLTAEEIAEMEKIIMFNPVTNVTNDANAHMAIEYIADANIYIDNLKAAHDADIRKLTAAIEALGGTVE